MVDWRKVLFVGWGGEKGVTWYRSMLPAAALDAEWVVFDMNGKGVSRRGENKKHDIIIVQQGWEPWQLQITRNMMKCGSKVLINIDDWVKAIGKLGDRHQFSDYFANKDVIRVNHAMLREADGVLASTDWLLDKCLSLNPRSFLARNGIDLERYSRFRTENREMGDRITLGWAGGTGHEGALQRLLPHIYTIMDEFDHVDMKIVGTEYTEYVDKAYKNRFSYHDWTEMEFYPRYLDLFDINLAPAEESDFYKAKSQLRFYEACAMGNPTIGHPMYDEIVDGVTGYIATDWVTELRKMITEPESIMRMGSNCLSYAQSISINERAKEWKTAIEAMM